MSRHKTLFSYAARILACANCAAPIEAEEGVVSVTCHYCHTPNQITKRDESIDHQLVQTQPTMSEAQRFEQLRMQDGQPLMPPPALQHLLTQGSLADHGVPAATEEWKRARQELMQGGSFGAAERLYFLTLMLYGHLSRSKQDLQTRALLETALEHLQDTRHRQAIHGMLARQAARVRDLDAAEQWLALCTPHSNDLHMDTAFRFSRAYVSTMKGDYQAALNALGSRVDDIPIADGSDHICAVLRANALERMGRGNEAVEQLTRMMLGPGGAQLIAAIIQANSDLQLCPHSFPLAQQQQEQTATNVVKTASGVTVGPIFLIAFGGPLLGVGGGALLDALGVTPHGILTAIAVGLYIVLLLASIFWTMSKGSRVRAHLEKTGVRGSATVLSANETGTRVNNQPVIALLLQVEAQGMQPFRAEHHQIISYAAVQRVAPGSRLQVMVDPSDPRQMAIDFD